MTKELSMEIMSPGTWNGFKFPSDRLKRIVDNFKKLLEVHRVPLKIGHADNQIEDETRSEDQHALGWVDDVWQTATGKLMAKVIDVPDIVYDAVAKKLYRKVSVELDFDVDYKGENIGDVLSGVALLGADIPAVNTIQDLQAFLSADSGTIAGARKAIFTTIDTGYKPKPNTDEVTEMDLKELEKKFDSLTSRFDAQQSEMDKLRAENAELKTKEANFEKAEKERLEAEKKAKIELARTKVIEILDKGVSEKHITPAQREDFSKMLQIDDDEAVQKIEFELVERMVGKGSVNFSTSRTSSSKSVGGEEETNDTTPDAVVAAKAQELINAGTAKTFKAAKRMVLSADTKLARDYIDYNDTLED